MIRAIGDDKELLYVSDLKPNGDKLLDFRYRVVLENGGHKDVVDRPFEYEEIRRRYAENYEDIYKFSFSKWQQTQFDRLESVLCDGQVICISGAKIYGQWLRIAMHHYLLKDYRHSHRSLLFRQHGMFQRHVDFAQTCGLQGLFFTIYPHNRRLAKFSEFMKNIKDYPIANERLDQRMKNFCWLANTVEFHGVPQNIFYWAFDPSVALSGEDLAVSQVGDQESS